MRKLSRTRKNKRRVGLREHDKIRGTVTPKEYSEGASILLAQMLKESETRAVVAERKYRTLRDALVSILTKDQLEAASIAGCDEAIYAIEYIKLQKEIFFPNHNALFKSLPALQGRSA